MFKDNLAELVLMYYSTTGPNPNFILPLNYILSIESANSFDEIGGNWVLRLALW